MGLQGFFVSFCHLLTDSILNWRLNKVYKSWTACPFVKLESRRFYNCVMDALLYQVMRRKLTENFEVNGQEICVLQGLNPSSKMC